MAGTLSRLFTTSASKDLSPAHNLGEEFSLCDNGTMVFHWADYHKTCDLIKERLQTDSTIQRDFDKREASVNRLELIPVWIRTKSKIHQTTMYELYERYILNQSHFLGVDPFGAIDISFISANGPFRNLAISECFNKSVYHDFVMLYLLKGKLPQRDYRIRLKSKVLLEYGDNFENAQLVHLEQLTASGLLLSVDMNLFQRQISGSKSVRLLIDSMVLKNCQGKTLEEIKEQLSPYSFNLLYSSRKEDAISCSLENFNVHSSFDFLKNNKAFLYIPYAKFDQASSSALKNIEGFMKHTQDLIHKYYQDHPLKKSA